MSDLLRDDSPQPSSCMPFPKLGMPIGMTGNRSPGLVNTAQFEISNPYHSQGIASGGSALLDAINRGKVHLAKFILDAGDDPEIVNTRDFKGKTPLIRACYIKEELTRDKSVSLLLSKGANVNVLDDAGRTALSYACELRVNDVVKILVKNNVDPDIPDDRGNTALIYSAMAGNDVAVEILIRSFRRLGLNVDYINNEGLTALLLAAKQGYIACASLLAIEGKACISFRDREKGMNAEEWARSQGCSTPEVMAFSTQAQFMGYRKVDGGSRGGSMRRDDDDRPRLEGASATSSDLDVDDLAHRLEGLDNGDTEKFFPNKDNNYLNVTSVPERRKRRSLPAIKFSSSLFSGRRSPKDGIRTPKRKSSGSKERGGRRSPISPGRQDQRSPVSPSSLSRHSPLGELSGSDVGEERRPGSSSSTATSASKVNCEVELLGAPPAGKGAKPKR